jgi:hypothetical protein
MSDLARVNVVNDTSALLAHERTALPKFQARLNESG